VKEVDGDLFTAPKEYSLAHCVATDMRMGSGIAVSFRYLSGFHHLYKLYSQTFISGSQLREEQIDFCFRYHWASGAATSRCIYRCN
jgi:hypothetical protein